MTKDMRSAELVAGIKAYDERIVALGGYGARVTGRTPDGVSHTGQLIELGFGGCQPAICDDAGKRWRIVLNTVTV